MFIGEVIGTVTLNRSHPNLKSGRYRLVVPLSLENLEGTSTERAEAIVVYDDLSAGNGSLIAVSQGGEAAQPFQPEMKPVDAYNAAILDHIDLANKRGSTASSAR